MVLFCKKGISFFLFCVIASNIFCIFVPKRVTIATAVYSVVAGTIGALASYIWKPFAVHFNNLSALLTDAMLGLSEGVARLPGSNFEIAPWGPLTCAAWYVAFALFLYLAHRIRLHRNLV